LNDEKIICQLQATLILRKCPVSRRAFSSLAFSREPGTVSQENALEHDPEKCVAVFRKDHAQTKTIWLCQKTGTIPA
jgi:hypothetical protein